MADSTGIATVREQRPKPDISWMAATRGVGMKASSFLLFHFYHCTVHFSIVQDLKLWYTAIAVKTVQFNMRL
jgi:hypothetical protein